MSLKDRISTAFAITDNMHVSGVQIEQMAALRQALREAYKEASERVETKEDESAEDAE